MNKGIDGIETDVTENKTDISQAMAAIKPVEGQISISAVGVDAGTIENRRCVFLELKFLKIKVS